MNNKHETTADISAELRTLSKFDTVIAPKDATGRLLAITVEGKPIDIYLAQLADRIDAVSVGNTAKMREALNVILHIAEEQYRIEGDYGGKVEALSQITSFAADALAAPPRNCDKYPTPMGLRMAFSHFCKNQNLCVSCPFWEGTKCEFQFALATAKEGAK